MLLKAIKEYLKVNYKFKFKKELVGLQEPLLVGSILILPTVCFTNNNHAHPISFLTHEFKGVWKKWKKFFFYTFY